jgi:hypothetical protein
MIIYLHPACLSVAALVAGVLGLLAFQKMGRLTRTSMLTVTRIGIVLVGPALFLFGSIYLYFITHPEINPQVYAYYLRWLLLYLLTSISLWFITVLFGREL